MSKTVTGLEFTGNIQVEGSDLQMIVGLCSQQKKLAGQIETMEEQLGVLKENLRRLSQETLPDKMAELGLESLTLKDGSKVTVEKFYAASISEERQGEAFEWLRTSGHGDIIKSVVSTVFKRGDENRRAQLLLLLVKAKMPFEQKDSVHHATLKAFVREMIESGQQIPTELFNIFIGNKTVIKEPKAAE